MKQTTVTALSVMLLTASVDATKHKHDTPMWVRRPELYESRLEEGMLGAQHSNPEAKTLEEANLKPKLKKFQ